MPGVPPKAIGQRSRRDMASSAFPAKIRIYYRCACARKRIVTRPVAHMLGGSGNVLEERLSFS